MTRLPTRSTLIPYTTLFRSPLKVGARRFSDLDVPGAEPALGEPVAGEAEHQPGDGTSQRRLPGALPDVPELPLSAREDRQSTRLNSSHGYISYACFCLHKRT